MVDGAVIVGVAGILTSGVLGPVVLHHISKDRESRNDLRNALDASTEPLTAAAARASWLTSRAFGPKDDDWHERLEGLLTQVRLVDSHVLRLRMRFGPCRLTEGYAQAADGLNEQGSVLWHISRGHFAQRVDAEQRLSTASDRYREGLNVFSAEARSWHTDTSWPYGS